MISCVICSNNTSLLQQVSASIEATIGVEYELLICNNAHETGICGAYNEAASKAKFSYICFMHDDVKFVTENWGRLAISHFQSAGNAGVLGVAGSMYKAKMVSGWWQPDVNGIEPKRVNVLQHFKYSNREKEHFYLNPLNEQRALVAVLDGVFLFTTKEIWSDHHFDENLLKGFHAYDLDYTLNVGTTYSNYVVFDILIEHFSEGANDINWFKSNIVIHKKWKKILPVIKSNVIKEKNLEPVDQLWLHQLLSFRVKSFAERFRIIFSCLPLLGSQVLKLSVLLSIYHYLFFQEASA